MEYVSYDEARYLIGLTLGHHGADFWNDNARDRLAAKLERLGRWAVKEDEAREAIRRRV